MLADDPYVLLAHSLLSHLTSAQIKRLLSDDEYIMRMIKWEMRQQDFSGEFTDCIMQSILDDKKRVKMYKELDKFSFYLFSELDKERLRSSVLKYGTFYNLL